MLFGRGHDFHWFCQQSRIDGLVGWRYLIDSSYRQRVRKRWHGQPMIMTATEVMAGTTSLLLPVLMAVGAYYLL